MKGLFLINSQAVFLYINQNLAMIILREFLTVNVHSNIILSANFFHMVNSSPIIKWAQFLFCQCAWAMLGFCLISNQTQEAL